MASYPTAAELSPASLRFDLHNARFAGRPDSQAEAFEALAAEQRARLLALARHIARFGLNPIRRFVVMPDDADSYLVLDGNRRLAALRILARPALMQRFLTVDQVARLKVLGEEFSQPDTVACMIFETRAQAAVWLALEHNGVADGAGLMAWNAEQRVRATGTPDSDASQVIEFVLPER